MSYFGDQKELAMVTVMALFALVALGQPSQEESSARKIEASWTAFYLDAAKEYKVTRASDQVAVPLAERAVFDWASISDYNGAVFAWTENGRPALVATIFSMPRANSQARLAVHEFASFAETDLEVAGPSGRQWKPPKLETLQRVPGAPPPPESENRLKLECRRLAKDFAAHMNRRGERWDLRLLPTPLVEYRKSSNEVLGGGLFAFVAFSTDPDVLLLIEARKTDEGPAWYFVPVRFSDKSLYLSFKEKQVWKSLRTAHSGEGTDTEDPHYRVMASEVLAPRSSKSSRQLRTKNRRPRGEMIGV